VNSATGHRSIWRRLLDHPSARRALVVIGLLVISAIVGALIPSRLTREQPDIVGLKSQPPSWSHPLGTDPYSRDVALRMLTGSTLSLSIASLTVFLATTVGILYGLVSGYFGGRIDSVMMRLLDGFLSIPRVLLLLAALALWSPISPTGLVLLIAATFWFNTARLVRGETLSTRRTDFVLSARSLGATDVRILWRHILPNVLTPAIVNATLAVGNVILLEAGLSFLGIGVQPPQASWGSMFQDAVTINAGNWWAVLFPGVAIAGTALAFNVLGDALRDVLDPRQVHGSRGTFVPTTLAPVSPVTQSSENG
jgi:peptide/nickel transport system permease protein